MLTMSIRFDLPLYVQYANKSPSQSMVRFPNKTGGQILNGGFGWITKQLQLIIKQYIRLK